jgi:hypothetical protein
MSLEVVQLPVDASATSSCFLGMYMLLVMYVLQT